MNVVKKIKCVFRDLVLAIIRHTCFHINGDRHFTFVSTTTIVGGGGGGVERLQNAAWCVLSQMFVNMLLENKFTD